MFGLGTGTFLVYKCFILALYVPELLKWADKIVPVKLPKF